MSQLTQCLFSHGESCNTQLSSLGEGVSHYSQTDCSGSQALRFSFSTLNDPRFSTKLGVLDSDMIFDSCKKFFKRYKEKPPLVNRKQEDLSSTCSATAIVSDVSKLLEGFSSKLDILRGVDDVKTKLEQLVDCNPNIMQEVLSKLQDITEQARLQTKMSEMLLNEAGSKQINRVEVCSISCQTEGVQFEPRVQIPPTTDVSIQDISAAPSTPVSQSRMPSRHSVSKNIRVVRSSQSRYLLRSADKRKKLKDAMEGLFAHPVSKTHDYSRHHQRSTKKCKQQNRKIDTHRSASSVTTPTKHRSIKPSSKCRRDLKGESTRPTSDDFSFQNKKCSSHKCATIHPRIEKGRCSSAVTHTSSRSHQHHSAKKSSSDLMACHTAKLRSSVDKFPSSNHNAQRTCERRKEPHRMSHSHRRVSFGSVPNDVVDIPRKQRYTSYIDGSQPQPIFRSTGPVKHQDKADSESPMSVLSISDLACIFSEE